MNWLIDDYILGKRRKWRSALFLILLQNKKEIALNESKGNWFLDIVNGHKTQSGIKSIMKKKTDVLWKDLLVNWRYSKEQPAEDPRDDMASSATIYQSIGHYNYGLNNVAFTALLGCLPQCGTKKLGICVEIMKLNDDMTK